MKKIISLLMTLFILTMSFASFADNTTIDYSGVENQLLEESKSLSIYDLEEISYEELELMDNFDKGSILNPVKAEKMMSERSFMSFDSVSEVTTSEKSTNQKPVAMLKYLIMNPESVVDGKFTTNTQIAWLWSYNGQSFLVDPDGDAITNMNIDGVPKDSIVGYLTGNIGFATKFSEAGQYILRFKCMDEHGLWSDVWSISVAVEATDGNQRPNCVINYSTLSGTTETNFVWGWFNSTDPDGDKISGIEGTVVKDGEYVSINNYIVSQDADGCSTKFDKAGTYTMMFRVKDSKNAWSNWVSVNAVVTDAVATELTNVKIVSVKDDNYKYFYTDMSMDADDYAPRRGIWVNERIGREALSKNDFEGYRPTFEPFSSILEGRPSDYGAESLVKIFATSVEKRKVIVEGFTISGETNKPNTTVAIAFDLFGELISKKAQTDSNGNFSVSFVESDIPKSHNTEYALFGERATSYFEPSAIKIILPNKVHSTPVYIRTDGYIGVPNIHNANASIGGYFVLRSYLRIGQPPSWYWEYVGK